jgi:L-threonylcarbamoyladenylate synthase
MTQTWSVDAEPPADVVHSLAEMMQRDRIALLPTDTIYGLHAMATSEPAVARIVSIKGREEEKPFVVLGASIEQLERLGVRFDARARRVVEELWPGPLTAVLPLNQPIAASRGALSLAVRVPDLPWLRDLLALTGPLASTSANRSGLPPISTPGDISPDLKSRIDAIVEAGRREGKPSSIVDFTGAEPQFIREGESFFTQKVWKTLRKSL